MKSIFITHTQTQPHPHVWRRKEGEIKEGKTLGSNCICQTSEGGASRVAIEALVSTSNTRTKLSREAEAAIIPDGCAATETTPKQWPVLVRSSCMSSGRHSFTVSSNDPVSKSAGRVSVAGTHVTAHTDSSCAFSTDFRPANFIWFGGHNPTNLRELWGSFCVVCLVVPSFRGFEV